MTVGIVKNRSVETNRDGENEVRMLGVDLYMDGNTESVQLARPAGEDTNPPDNAVIYVLPAGEAYKIGFVIDDGITPTMDKGEKKIYSVDAGTVKAFINLLKNGNIELNGNAKGVARLDDSTLVNATTDTAIISWISAVSAFINGLAPGTIPVVPTTITGKISTASATVKTG